MEISGRSCAVTAKNCTVLKSVMLVQNYCFACVFVQGDKGVFRDVMGPKQYQRDARSGPN